MRQRKIQKYTNNLGWMAPFIPCSLSLFAPECFDSTETLATRRTLCSYFTASCAIKNAFSRVSTFQTGFLSSCTSSSLCSLFWKLVITNRALRDHFPFIFLFVFFTYAFEFISNLYPVVHKSSRFLEARSVVILCTISQASVSHLWLQFRNRLNRNKKFTHLLLVIYN